MSGEGAKTNFIAESVPYVGPLLVFMIFLSFEGAFREQHYVLYPIKTVVVAVILAWYWRAIPSLKPSSLFLSLAVGVVGIVCWIELDPWALKLDIVMEQLYNHAVSAVGLNSWQTEVNDGSSMGRSPFELYTAGVAWTLFGIRVLGITLCVPIMEELFWRGFLMRWLIREDFTSVPLGTYQPMSFWVTTLFFASVHGPEWPQALIVGILYGAWFVRTKNLGNVMLAHGVTNLLLCFYCLASATALPVRDVLAVAEVRS